MSQRAIVLSVLILAFSVSTTARGLRWTDTSYPDQHGGVLEKSFAQRIRTGQPDYANLRQAIQAWRVIHAAIESDRTGHVVPLDPSLQKV